ncbi:MAG: transporter permease [Haloplasmataceae bacterium]|jgi:ABC-type sugar transport system permease subunit|nr:transporter permease [Haloplasmataceae bacterium]
MTKKFKRKAYNKNEAIWGYIFISVWLIGFLVFTLVPMAQSFYYSLNNARFAGSTMELAFIKFENYRRLFFTDELFPPLIIRYITETVINVPIALVFSLLIAMLINQKIKGRGIWRVIFFLPVVIASGPVMNELGNQGATTVPLLNNPSIYTFLHEYLPEFLFTPLNTLFSKMIMVLWFTGIPVLIFLAGLQKIDRAVYEAAAIDGASPWESFWKVTLPAVKPFITVNMIYLFVSMSYNSSFAGSEIITYIQDQSFFTLSGLGFGYGSAIAWIFFGVIVILISAFIGLLNIKREK